MPAPSFPPAVALHTTTMLAATLLGPVAMLLRRHRRWHRMVGGLWVLLMVTAALSAGFISGSRGSRWLGMSPLHLLIPVTFGCLLLSLAYLRRGHTTAHARTLQGLYVGACLVAGAFTLLPGRRLGNALTQWLSTFFT